MPELMKFKNLVVAFCPPLIKSPMPQRSLPIAVNVPLINGHTVSLMNGTALSLNQSMICGNLTTAVVTRAPMATVPSPTRILFFLVSISIKDPLVA